MKKKGKRINKQNDRKKNEQKKTMLTKDKKRRNQGFQRGWTKNILFTQKKEMADSFLA